MKALLRVLLWFLMPSAIRWAQDAELDIRRNGWQLTAKQLQTALKIGVSRPERIRVYRVESVPPPNSWMLRKAADIIGLKWEYMGALTVGYGIYVKDEYYSPELIAHECRHVWQYETFGSTERFFKEYLTQVIMIGYEDAPLEIDARRAVEAIGG